MVKGAKKWARRIFERVIKKQEMNIEIERKWIIAYGFELFLTRVILAYPCTKGHEYLGREMRSGDEWVLDPRQYKMNNDRIGTIMLNDLDPMVIRMCVGHHQWDGSDEFTLNGHDMDFIRLDMIKIEKKIRKKVKAKGKVGKGKVGKV